MKHFWKMLAVVGILALITLSTTQLQTLVSAAGETAVPQSPIEVEPELLARFARGEEPTYLIYFQDKADLSAAHNMDWEARGWYVMETLQAAADSSQKNVRTYLDAQRVPYQAFWIDNLIVVQASDYNTFNGLLSFTEIAQIRADVENFLIEPEEASRQGGIESIFAPEPNLVQVKATDTWALGLRGQGTVIANIDSGVRHTHEALVNQYRGNLGGGNFDHNFNWLDPDGGSAVPIDGNGHGTHVMGTMVGYDGGANEIGVAPDAEWIACRGCLTSSCPTTALLSCAEWIAAPYAIGNPGSADPNMRPYAVNNSWGSCQTSYDPWYQGVVDGWHAAGVFPVFANGNASNCGYPAPPGLNTVGNPARYGNVTGVGSSGTNNGQYATHSNWGPTDNPDTVNPQPGFAYLKPQVIAPGVSIRSSVPSSDIAYQSSGWTGTSMSAPHVTGMIALMWEAAGCLIGDYATTETIIEQSARPVPYASGGTPPPGSGDVPNYATGWGEIDVLAAVQQAQGLCGPTGSIEGTVTDSGTTAPLAGVSIEATLDITTTKTATTDALGEYVIAFAPEGIYTMTASAFGYLPTTLTNVAVVSGTVTTQDIALDPAPSYTVSGVVTDANTGWPLYAKISVADVPGSPFWNDPETGAYSITLPGGAAYDFTVEAFVNGYVAEDRAVAPFNSNVTEDFELDVDAAACVAPGYGLSYLYFENFQASNGDYTLSGAALAPWQWGQPTTWPAACAEGTNCWGTNLTGLYNPSANETLTSPVIDLSSVAPGTTLTARWYQANHIETFTWDKAYAEVSIDGGPWTIMWQNPGSTVAEGWRELTYDVSAAAGTNVQLRWRFTSDSSVQHPGLYIDRVAIADDAGCAPTAGGLVVGNVYDENTGDPLVGAAVAGASSGVVAVATPLDPNVDDAFYTIFAPAGSATLTATFGSQYAAAVANLTVADGTTQAQDFDLPAGWLVADPDTITVTVQLGSTGSATFDLDNLGNAAVNWEISAKDEGFMPFVTEQILVVRWDTANADAMQSALTSLGYTFLGVTDAIFRTIPVSELLEYEAVFYAGLAPVDTLPFLTAYLDAGGSLLIADNDLGWGRGTTPFYQQYLQATYNVDNAGDLLTGEDLMAGLDLDITPDPFPDGFTVGAEGTRIFKYTTNDHAGGSVIERMDYRAVYLAFDVQHVAGAANRDEMINRILGFLVAGDVPWLATDPITGTLSALGTQLITVDFDATIAEVPEPGVYSALLQVSNDTPYGRLQIPVTMNVTASPTLGLLEGVVQSQGYCDNDPFPAAGAEIVITSGANTWTRTADDNGYYYIYLDESYSPVTVTANAPQHISDTATGVALVGLQTTTQDFDLRWLQPCLDVDPTSMDQTVPFGQTATQMLTLTNTGAISLTFELREQDGGFTPAFSIEATPKPQDIGTNWETMAPLPSGRVFSAVVADQNGYVYVMGGTSDGAANIPTNTNYRYNTATNTWDTMAPIPVAIDSIDAIEINNKVYIPGGATTAVTYVYDIAANTWSNIPANGGYTARSQYQVVAIGTDLYVLGGIVAAASASTPEVWKLDTTAGTWTASAPMQKTRTSFSAVAIDGVIYVAGGVAFPGFAPDMTAEKFDGTSWSYIAPVPGGGTLTRWSYNADAHGADGLWLAAGRRDTDWTVLNHAGYYDPNTDTWTTSPTIPTLAQGRVYMEGDVATDGYFYVIGGRDGAGAIAYANNERLYVGSPASGDVEWLDQDPQMGIVAPDGGDLEITVTFDASVVTEPGEYAATIRVVSNDPMMGSVNIPVTMTVEPSATAGRIEGTVQSLGYCDNNPFPAEGAEVVITSGANSWTVYADATGAYGLWLDESFSPVDISVTAPEHTSGSATGVVIVPQDVTTVDFDLRLLEPCVSVEPEMFNVEMGMGSMLTLPLTIDNAGAAALNWQIAEAGVAPTLQIPLSSFFAASAAAVDRANYSGQTDEPIPSQAPSQVLPTASPLLFNDWSMGFEDITQLPGLGWALINNSSPLGTLDWFQGNTEVFSAHQGPADSYVAANFNNTGSVGTISNWLLTPEMTLQDGATISFYTRTALDSIWADRLELRMSLNGGSTDVGSTATSVGDFTTLLLSVNPDQASTGYPQVWTQYTATLSGIGAPTNGRLAFRYFVTDAGANGTNSNYIGIDTVEYEIGVPPVGCQSPEDISWLSVSPTSGTAAADGQSMVNVAFDATGLDAGDYEAVLCVTSNDPMMPLVEVPVSMTVAEADAAIDLNVMVSLDNMTWAETLVVEPGSVVYYRYTVTNTGNIMLPNHIITDTVFGHITTFVYNLMPDEVESVVFTQTISADTTSTARWMASHAGLDMSAMAEDTVSVTLTTRYIFLPIIMKP